jgi:hypothetical protein
MGMLFVVHQFFDDLYSNLIQTPAQNRMAAKPSTRCRSNQGISVLSASQTLFGAVLLKIFLTRIDLHPRHSVASAF